MSQPVSYTRLIKNPDYTRILASSIISSFGSSFGTIAEIVLLKYLWNTEISLGIWYFLWYFTNACMTPIVGYIIDKTSSINVIISCNVVTGILGSFMILAYHIESLAVFFSVAILTSISSSFIGPADNTFLPEVLSKKYLLKANSLSTTCNQVARVVSLGIGGLYASQFGLDASFIFDTSTFVVAALIMCSYIFWSGYDPDVNKISLNVKSDKENLLQQMVKGWSYLKTNPHLMWLVWIKTIENISLGYVGIGNVFLASMVFNGTDDLDVVAFRIGLCYAVGALGSIIAPILSTYLTGGDSIKMKKCIFVALFGVCISVLMLGLTFLVGVETPIDEPPSTRYYLSGVLWLLSTFIFSGSNVVLAVIITTILQEEVPENIRGRVMATSYGLRHGMLAISSLVIGWLLTYDGYGHAIIGGVISIIIFITGCLYYIFRKSTTSYSII